MSIPILYLDNTLTYGGAMLSLKNLLSALDRKRFEPVVISGQPAEVLARDFPATTSYSRNIRLPWLHAPIYYRVRKWRLASLFPLNKFFSLWRFSYWFLVHDLPDSLGYWRIGRRHRIEIVHLNNILGSQLSGILAAKLLGVPCVAHLRDFERNSVFTRSYARWIDHHIAISAAIRANLLELGVPAERISIVHDSLNPEEFSPQKAKNEGVDEDTAFARGHLTFGLFGRIVAWKGVREFVLAAAQVLIDHPGARAFIVGSAPHPEDSYAREVTRLISELGLKARICMTGYRQKVVPLMGLMDVIVHASTRPEPFGMVVIEGMALEKPVVATAAGGPLDIVVPEETGLLVPPGDSQSLARAISTLLKGSSRRQEMGKRGRQRVEALFSHQASARKIENIYADLLKPGFAGFEAQNLQELK